MLQRIRASVLAIAVFVVLGGGVALAQDSFYTARQHGYDHGYRDGYHQALSDRAAGLSYNYQSPAFERGDRGYASFMGDLSAFVGAYREAYKSGYDDGWNGRSQRLSELYPYRSESDVYGGQAAPPATWGRDDIAFDIGYRIGLQQGRHDAAKREDFDPDHHDEYRDADKGYHHEYGNKDVYKRNFRTGYVQGYQDGFGRLR